MPPRRDPDPDVTPDTPPDAGTADAAPADQVTLAVGYPHDEFAPFGSDDPDHKLVITASGTPVPAGRVDDIEKAAKAADVTIRKVR